MMFRKKKMQDRIEQLDDDSKQKLIDALSTLSNEKFRTDKLYSELLKVQSTDKFLINLSDLSNTTEDVEFPAKIISSHLFRIKYHEIVDQIREIDNLDGLLKLKSIIEVYLENDKKWDILESIKKIIVKLVEFMVLFIFFFFSLFYFMNSNLQLSEQIKNLDFKGFILGPMAIIIGEIVFFCGCQYVYSAYKVNGKGEFLLLQIENRQKELEK